MSLKKMDPAGLMAKAQEAANADEDEMKDPETGEDQEQSEEEQLADKVKDKLKEKGGSHGFKSLLNKMNLFKKGYETIQAITGFFSGGIPAMLSRLLSLGLNAVKALGMGFWHALTGLWSALTGVVSSALGAMGITAAAGVINLLTSWVIVAAVAVVAAIGSVVADANRVNREVGVLDCAQQVEEAMKGANGSVEDGDAVQMEHAQKTYAVLHKVGLDDAQIAGVLGNWSVESGIDPTTIEGIYDEKYNADGPRHKAAMQDFDSYVRNELMPAYGGAAINWPQYMVDGKYYPGLGLGQWTGAPGVDLMKCSDAIGRDWYDMDAQLAYTCSTRYRGGIKAVFDANRASTPEAAADVFLAKWEGCPGHSSLPQRQSAAREWYERMKAGKLKADEGYASSILSMANKLGAAATDNAVKKAKAACITYCSVNNTSIADAAVSFAWPTVEQSMLNDGTELYQKVFDSIFPGDVYKQSCDRGAATAIRWSGYDDDFPIGDCRMQYTYLEEQVSGAGSGKWKKVGIWQQMTKEELEPGDVMVAPGDHTMIYVGHDLIAKYHPTATADSDTVSASIAGRSPACWNEASRLHDYTTDFHVYRNINTERSDKYGSAGGTVKVAANTTGKGNCQDAMVESIDLEGSALGKKIAQAALKRIGEKHQCTELATLAMQDAGISGVGVYWPDQYPTEVPRYANAIAYPYNPGIQPSAGDLIVYGHAHIAVYVGDGQAVHGNFGDGCGPWNPPCPTALWSWKLDLPITRIIHFK